MPLNCSQNRLACNACLSCSARHENECWANLPISQKLVDILTIDERIAILENRPQVPEVNIVTISHQDYQQLQRCLLLVMEKLDALTERLNSHLSSSKGKKSRYD